MKYVKVNIQILFNVKMKFFLFGIFIILLLKIILFSNRKMKNIFIMIIIMKIILFLYIFVIFQIIIKLLLEEVMIVKLELKIIL